MGGAQREADRRNGVSRFLEPPRPLRHAGAVCPDGPGQGGDRIGQCAARPGRQILPIAAALFGRAERSLRAAIAPDQGGHQGCPRRCAGRARPGGRAGVRRRRRSPGDTRVVPPADVDVPRLGREAAHARRRGAGREPGRAGLDRQRVRRLPHSFAGRRPARLRTIRGRRRPGDGEGAPCRRAARRHSRRQGAKAYRRGARQGSATKHGRTALPRRAAAGARRRREMAHRAARSRARRRVRFVPGKPAARAPGGAQARSTRPKCGPSEPAHAQHRGARGESIDGDTGERRQLRGPRHEVAQHPGDVGAPIGTHAQESSGRKLPVDRIDDDAHRGKSEPMRGGEAGDDMRFHVDCGRAGRSVQLELFRRLGDRIVNTDDRSVHRSGDHAQKLGRPRRIGDARRSAIRGRRKRPPNRRRAGRR